MKSLDVQGLTKSCNCLAVLIDVRRVIITNNKLISRGSLSLRNAVEGGFYSD